jgi:hypothetical protein
MNVNPRGNSQKVFTAFSGIDGKTKIHPRRFMSCFPHFLLYKDLRQLDAIPFLSCFSGLRDIGAAGLLSASR